MGSSRLPGKVLAPVGGRPMLRFMLDRLATLDVAHLVVATSLATLDDAVAEAALDAGAEVVRGSEHDVLDRFRSVIEKIHTGTVVRLTGDCPLTDPAVVAATIELHQARGADYTCNVLPRTFPKGLDVEVLSAPALLSAASEATDPEEREHVTPFLYRRPERFQLANLLCPEDLHDERWTVDTPEDLDFIRRVVDSFGPEALGWRQILDRIGRQAPERGTIYLRPARVADQELLSGWGDDSEADAVCEHCFDAETGSRYSCWMSPGDPARRVWIGYVNDRAVGWAVIHVTGGVAEIGLLINPCERGRGYGKALMTELLRLLDGDLQVQSLQAVVDARNVPWIRTLMRSSFWLAGEEDGSLRFVRGKDPS